MQINQNLCVAAITRRILLTDWSYNPSLLQGDGMHNAGALLPELVDAGVRLLIYSGQADMCKTLCIHILD